MTSNGLVRYILMFLTIGGLFSGCGSKPSRSDLVGVWQPDQTTTAVFAQQTPGASSAILLNQDGSCTLTGVPDLLWSASPKGTYTGAGKWELSSSGNAIKLLLPLGGMDAIVDFNIVGSGGGLRLTHQYVGDDLDQELAFVKARGGR